MKKSEISIAVVFGLAVAMAVVSFAAVNWKKIERRYLPCRTVINYSIGFFDERFGMSKEEFLAAVEEAELVWEGEAGRELFGYSDEGALKINLVYDGRQQATDFLKNLGIAVDESRESFDTLKAKYDRAKADYLQEKSAFDSRYTDFKRAKEEYELKAAVWNRNPGSSKQKYDALVAEQEALNADYREVSALQSSLNSKAEQLNALAVTLNRLAAELNLDIARFNDANDSVGGEFEEGSYRADADGEQINIYQFSSRDKLVRVLVHELGHALGLNHVDDPEAVMYRLNAGSDKNLSPSDVSEMKKVCGFEY